VGGLWRVLVGPYADRAEAARVADRIANAFGFAATVRPN
jgi:cell division septation protein DedD